MKTSNKKIIKDSDFIITTTEGDSQIKTFSEVINSFSNHLQNIIKTISTFKYQHSRLQQRYDQQTKAYLTYNCFQMKLVSTKEYLQAQKELKQILQKNIKVQQQTKNGKYQQKNAKHQIILQFTQNIKNCSDLIKKSKNLISLEKTCNDIEYKSKKQCNQHLDQFKEYLNFCVNNLITFFQRNQINSQTKMKSQENKEKNQDEKSVKKALIRNQQILKNLFDFMLPQQSPKKEYKGTASTSSSKYLIQNLKFYKDLKQIIRLMLEQSQKMTPPQTKIEEKIKYYTFMLDCANNSQKKIEELYEFKSKSTISEQQFMNHLNQIKKQIQTLKENLQKIWSECQKQLVAIFKSTAQIDFCLQKTLIKYQNTQIIEETLGQILLQDLMNLSEKNSLIQRKIIKIHQITQKKEAQIYKLKKQIGKSMQIKCQFQEEGENHRQQSTVVQCLFGKQEMKEIIEIKLSEQKRLLQDLHKAEIDKLNREFEVKIKEFETKVYQKDFKIQELTLKINEFEEVINRDLKNKDDLFKQETSNKDGYNKVNDVDQFAPIDNERMKSQEVVLITLNDEIEGKRVEWNELTIKVSKLNECVDKLKAEEESLINSNNYKKSQIEKLEKQIASKSQLISHQLDSNNSVNKDQQQQKIQCVQNPLNVNKTNSKVINTENQQEKYQQPQVNSQSLSSPSSHKLLSGEPITKKQLELNQSQQIKSLSSQESQFSVLTVTEKQQSNQSKQQQQDQKRILQQKKQKQVKEENQNKKEQQKQQGKVNQVNVQKVQEQANQKNVQIDQQKNKLPIPVNDQEEQNVQQKTQQNNTNQSEEGTNQVTKPIQQSVHQMNRNNRDQNNNQNENNHQSEKANQKQLQLVTQQLELQRQTVTQLKQTMTVIEEQLRGMIIKTKQTQMYKQLFTENKQQLRQKNNQMSESSQQLFNLDMNQYIFESKEKQTQLTQIVNQMNAFVEQLSKTIFIKFDQLESKLKEIRNTHLQLQTQKSNNHKDQLQAVKSKLEEMNNKNNTQQKELKQKSQQFIESAQRLIELESQIKKKLTEIETKDNYIKDFEKINQERQSQIKQTKKCLIKIINAFDFTGFIEPNNQLDNNENHQQSSDLQLLIKQFNQSRNNLIKSLGNKKSFQTQINSSQQQESKPINQFTELSSTLLLQLSSMLTSTKQSINQCVVKSTQIKTQTLQQQQKLNQIKQTVAGLQTKKDKMKTQLAQRQKQLTTMQERKQQKITESQLAEQQLTASFMKTIESNLIKTVNITQMSQQIKKLQQQLTKEKQLTATHKQEQQINQNSIKQLKQTNQSHTQTISSLQTEITSLKQEIQSLQQNNTQILTQNNQNKQIITQLKTLKEEKEKQIDDQIIKINQLQEKTRKDLITITSLQKDKQNLTIQLTKINQNIIKIKAQNKQKLNQLNLQSNHLSTLFQFEKGKNQANLKQINELIESVKTLNEQKTKNQLQNQKIKIQIQNLLKEEKELKQNLKNKENEIEANMIDFDGKLSKQQNLNAENSVKIKSLTDQVTLQKTMIEVRDTQIKGLKENCKQMGNHIITLQKVQTQKEKLDVHVIELNKKIKDLQQQCDKYSRQTTQINQSSTSEQRQLKAQIQKLQQRETQITNYYERLNYCLVQEYQKQKSAFQKQAIRRIEETINNFNSVNRKLKEQKTKYHQESLRLSAYLVSVYQAMSKMNEFYQTRLTEKYFNVNSHENILKSVAEGVLLTEQQSKQIVLYAVKTVKTLETLIRLTEKNSKQKIDSYDNKIVQIINKISTLNSNNKQQAFKQTLVKLSKSSQKINPLKKQQNTDLIDQVELSFNSFVSNVVKFIKEQEISTIQLVNQLGSDKKQMQEGYKKKIAECEAKYKIDVENQIKIKDKQINELNQQLKNSSSSLKIESQKLKILNTELDSKKQQIYQIQNKIQKNSFDSNKRFKQEKEKLEGSIKQKQQKLKDLQYELQTQRLKITGLQKQHQKLKNNNNDTISDLQATIQQNDKLKRSLQDSKRELNTIKNSVALKESQISKLKNQVNNLNSTIESLEQQISDKQVTIAQKNQQSSTKNQQISTLTNSINQITSQSNKKITSLTQQLSTLTSQLKDIESQLNNYKSLLSNISNTFSQKVNKHIPIQQLQHQIKIYQPPAGMKLICSSIFNGFDKQRSQVVSQCEKFINKVIKKTEMLVRYPDAKTVYHQLPKEDKNFPFILLFKTAKGNVFGSFSQGMQKQTFFFSFIPINGQENQINFYFAENKDSKVSPVQIVQKKYLQFGSGEFRLNCLELATVSANSDIAGEMHYNFNWKKIMNQQNEVKVPVNEIELHKVEFQ